MNNNSFKYILLGATFSTGNMGVSALTIGAIKCIVNKDPKARIYLLDYGKEDEIYKIRVGDKIVSIYTLNMRFSKKLYLANNIAVLIALVVFLKFIPFKKFKNDIVKKNNCLKNIYDADIIASIAGGDSFSDIYGISRFLYVTLPQILVILIGKKIILLPQTLGPFKNIVVKQITKYILNKASLIYSRDYEGIKEIKKWKWIKNKKKMKFCHDLGFIIDPLPPQQINLKNILLRNQSNNCIIGLNVSGLLYKGGYSGGNMFGLKIDYKKFINELISFLIIEKHAKIILIPHVFGVGEDSESDSVVCKKIYNEMKPIYKENLLFTNGFYSACEIKYIIGYCDFFIGSRMHACIAALSQHIPTVGIAYSKKFKGVFETINVGHLVADPRIMNERDMLSVIGKAYEDRDGIRENLRNIMPQIIKNIIKTINEATSY